MLSLEVLKIIIMACSVGSSGAAPSIVDYQQRECVKRVILCTEGRGGNVEQSLAQCLKERQ